MNREINKEELTYIFKRYTEKFIEEITNLNSRLELYDQIFDYRDEIANNSYFMSLVLSSFSKDIIMTLSKFYENMIRRKNSDYDINDYLNLCEKIYNSEIYFFKYSDISNKIEEHKKRIEEMKDVVNKLLVWRDKKIAHFDKEPFINRKFLIEEAPISKKELEQLKKIIIDILNTYSYAYSGKIYAYRHKSINNLDIKKIINSSKD